VWRGDSVRVIRPHYTKIGRRTDLIMISPRLRLCERRKFPSLLDAHGGTVLKNPRNIPRHGSQSEFVLWGWLSSHVAERITESFCVRDQSGNSLKTPFTACSSPSPFTWQPWHASVTS
jgi:hypothetical protein